MLVFSRDRDQSVVITDIVNGREVEIARIMVTYIKGNRIKLGTTAPGLGVHRDEVWDRILQEQSQDRER